jgi:hypothetical protein
VDDHRHAIGRQLDVEFDAVGAVLYGQAKGGQRVFGGVGAGAPVSNEKRSGSVLKPEVQLFNK